MRCCTFAKGDVEGCLRLGGADELVVYTFKGESVVLPELDVRIKIRRLERSSNLWDLVYQIYFDEPCDVVCVTEDVYSAVLMFVSLLRRDRACAIFPREGVKVNLTGAWMLLQLDNPLRVIALYALKRGLEGISPKEVVSELWDKLGLEKGLSAHKLAWNYLKELEKKGILERVSRGRYVVRKELLEC